MKILSSRFFNWSYIVILSLLVFVPLYHGAPEIWSDTAKYLHFDSSRPILYPIFLWLFHGFGNDQLNVVMWVQGALNFLTLLYVNKWLRERFQLPTYLTFIVSFVTIALIFNYFKMVQNITAEALAFPLFVLTITALVDTFKKFDIKRFFSLMLFCNLLILTREQFYYFYPLCLLVVAWHFWKHANVKMFLQGLAIFISSILIASFLTKTYQYSINHQFRGSSHAGELFISQMLYLSSPGDNKYFTNPTEKLAFEKIMKKLQKLKITKQSAYDLHPPLTLDAAYNHFTRVVIDIETYAKLNLPASMNAYEVNDTLLHISKTLFLHSIKNNLMFYTWKTASVVGGLWILIGFLMILSVFSLRAITDRKWNPSLSQIFIATALMTIISNAIFISVVAHYETRYFYYSYYLYFILAALVAKEFVVPYVRNTAETIVTQLDNKLVI